MSCSRGLDDTIAKATQRGADLKGVACSVPPRQHCFSSKTTADAVAKLLGVHGTHKDGDFFKPGSCPSSLMHAYSNVCKK